MKTIPYNEKDIQLISNNMILYGSEFWRHVGNALAKADSEEVFKMCFAFASDFKSFFEHKQTTLAI